MLGHVETPRVVPPSAGRTGVSVRGMETPMNRTVALLMFLLIATNAAWFIHSAKGPVPEVAAPMPAPAALEEAAEREREFRTEIGRLNDRVMELEGGVHEATPRRSKPEKTAEEKARVAASIEARKLKKRWVADMEQIEDPALRDQVISGLVNALISGTEAERLAALWTLCATFEVDYDRSVFPPLVLPSLRSGNHHFRSAAARALAATKAGPDYIDAVLSLVPDQSPEVRGATAYALLRLSAYRPDEKVSRALVLLLHDENTSVQLNTFAFVERMNSLPEEIEAKLLYIAENAERNIRPRALGVLARVPQKSERVLTLFLSRLADENHEFRTGAYRAFGEKTPDEVKRRVADAVLVTMRKYPTYNDINQCTRILYSCGDASDLPALESIAGNPMLSKNVGQSLNRWLERFRKQVSR
jgi:HEAT repeat protein